MPITFFVEPEKPLEPVAEALDSARVERQQTALATYRAAVEASASGLAKPLTAKQQVELLGAMDILKVTPRDFSFDIEVFRKIAEATASLGDYVEKASEIERRILANAADVMDLKRKLVLAEGHAKVLVLEREALADVQGGIAVWRQLNARLFGGDGNLPLAAAGKPTIDRSNSGSFLDTRTDMIVARPDGTTYGAPERRPA